MNVFIHVLTHWNASMLGGLRINSFILFILRTLEKHEHSTELSPDASLDHD
jgi:hypothetical protein